MTGPEAIAAARRRLVERALAFVAEFKGDDRCALNCYHSEALAAEVFRLRSALFQSQEALQKSSPTKLEQWECNRVVHLLREEVNSRHRYPGTIANPIGDPSDVTALNKAIRILQEAVKS